MINYKLNDDNTFAVRVVDGISTGEWHNILTSVVFKEEIAAGSQLEDADGNLMTAEQAKEFVATLP